MFWITAAFCIATAALHAARTGELFDEQGWAERIARFAITLTLVTLAVGIVERARTESPFLWIHWLVLGATIGATIAYGYLMLCQTRDSRRRNRLLGQVSDEIVVWLNEVEHFEPCHNADCERIRAEMRALSVQLDPRQP